MLEKLLENQERGKNEMKKQLDPLSTKIDANGKAFSSRLDGVVAHVKSFNNNISQMIEEQEESTTHLFTTPTLMKNIPWIWKLMLKRMFKSRMDFNKKLKILYMSLNYSLDAWQMRETCDKISRAK